MCATLLCLAIDDENKTEHETDHHQRQQQLPASANFAQPTATANNSQQLPMESGDGPHASGLGFGRNDGVVVLQTTGTTGVHASSFNKCSPFSEFCYLVFLALAKLRLTVNCHIAMRIANYCQPNFCEVHAAICLFRLVTNTAFSDLPKNAKRKVNDNFTAAKLSVDNISSLIANRNCNLDTWMKLPIDDAYALFYSDPFAARLSADADFSELCNLERQLTECPPICDDDNVDDDDDDNDYDDIEYDDVCADHFDDNYDDCDDHFF